MSLLLGNQQKLLWYFLTTFIVTFLTAWYNYNAYLLADNNSISIRFGKYDGTNSVNLIENEDFGNCSIIKATKNILNKLEIENKKPKYHISTQEFYDHCNNSINIFWFL